MADDPYARIAQLKAELRQMTYLHEAASAENASLRQAPAAGVDAPASRRQRQTAPSDAPDTGAEPRIDLPAALQATAEILRAIVTSPTDVQPVLDAICQSAMRVSSSPEASLSIRDGDHLRIVAGRGEGSSSVAYVGLTWPLSQRRPAMRCIAEARTIQIHDGSDPALDAEYPDIQSRFPQTSLEVPLLHEHTAIGLIRVARPRERGYSAREIALVETFADQAAIAVISARLIAEIEQRNAELQGSNRQVTEALEQQTATAEVLRVIASSPTDLDGVLQAIIDAAARLCEAPSGALMRYRERDGRLAPYAVAGRAREMRDQTGNTFENARGSEATRTSGTGRAFVERRTIHVRDMAEASLSEYPDSREIQQLLGHRTIVYVPMLRHGMPIGVLAMQHPEVRPFTEQQIALLETFADQAVIAIENARLFSELERRNRELGEALGQQTATSEILRVIASSQADLQPVFEAIVTSALSLSHSSFVRLGIVDGASVSVAAGAMTRSYPVTPDVGLVEDLTVHTPGNVAIRDGRTVVIVDRSTPEFRAEYPGSGAWAVVEPPRPTRVRRARNRRDRVGS